MSEIIWMTGFTICFMLVMFIIPIILCALEEIYNDHKTDELIKTINYKRRWKEKMSNGTLEVK